MSEPWSIHTLVFDLDDTLYPERDFVLSGFTAVDSWLEKAYGRTGFLRHAERHFTAGVRGTIFNAALADLGLEGGQDLVAKLVDVYRSHVPRLELFPDAADVLAWAETRFKIAIVTDGFSAVQKRKIQALKLEHRIPVRVISDDLGADAWKPNPKPFRRVMELSPGEPAGYVYVADNPRKDFIGPRALGWRTVRVRRSAGEHVAYEPDEREKADVDIQSLSELRTRLQNPN